MVTPTRQPKPAHAIERSHRMKQVLAKYHTEFEAWLAGADVQVLQAKCSDQTEDVWITDSSPTWDNLSYTYRVAPKLVMLGHHEVPEPVRSASTLITTTEVFVLSLNGGNCYQILEVHHVGKNYFDHGLVFRTGEEAQCAAKAIISLLTAGWRIEDA